MAKYDEKNENHENFLKGTNFEAKLTDGDFEDSYNECIGSNNLLAFDYVLNYEGSDKTEKVAEINEKETIIVEETDKSIIDDKDNISEIKEPKKEQFKKTDIKQKKRLKSLFFLTQIWALQNPASLHKERNSHLSFLQRLLPHLNNRFPSICEHSC